MAKEEPTIGERVPLVERVNGEWTEFEMLLFNLVTRYGPKIPGYFSTRLQVTQKMLDAMDHEIKYLELCRSVIKSSLD